MLHCNSVCDCDTAQGHEATVLLSTCILIVIMLQHYLYDFFPLTLLACNSRQITLKTS